jgi:hypothetical protein
MKILEEDAADIFTVEKFLLKMEAAQSSATLVAMYLKAPHHISEVINFFILIISLLIIYIPRSQ